jgi:hypothetical protein
MRRDGTAEQKTLHGVKPPDEVTPCEGPDQVFPAPQGFSFEVSGNSVTLAVARYDYSADWTPCARPKECEMTRNGK